MIRIYTKPRGQMPDYNAPVILHRDSRSVEQLCNRCVAVTWPVLHRNAHSVETSPRACR